MTVEALKALLRTSITPNDPSYNAIVCEIYRRTPDSNGQTAGFIPVCPICRGAGAGMDGRCLACMRPLDQIDVTNDGASVR